MFTISLNNERRLNNNILNIKMFQIMLFRRGLFHPPYAVTQVEFKKFGKHKVY